MRIPIATYRIQFEPSFGFPSALQVLPYLARLGISDLYASPIFRARRRSVHGYDVVDPNQLNPELGSREEFYALIALLHQYDMGWLQDFVPNHMAYGSENSLLMDIFEKGPSSPYYEFFDIRWDHPSEVLRGKLLAPFLGKPYREALESGEISLQYRPGGFRIKYFDFAFPLRIESYATLIGYHLEALKERLGEGDPDLIKLLGLFHLLMGLPPEGSADNRRNVQIEFAKQLLGELFQRNRTIQEFIQENVAAFNERIDLLDGLLSQQWFRFTFWKFAAKEINYRRFFNINGLISLRIGTERVFHHIHRLVLDLVQAGQITGLRLDHIDGLYDPTRYLAMLREQAGDLFIVVEKILELSEELPGQWPIQGTTGYEFLNYVNGLFCETDHRERFQKIYQDFTGRLPPYEDLIYEKKRFIIEAETQGKLDNLAHFLKDLSARVRDGVDLTLTDLREALATALSCFPVYRTYTQDDRLLEQDLPYIQGAIEQARTRRPDLTRELLFLERILRLDFPDDLALEGRTNWISFGMRFQQFTSSLMAKGLEDTVFYIFNRLISLNEVGGNPAPFGVSLPAFHRFNQQRAAQWPHTLNATATHDTKRGEDVRARINVLSEIPEEWERSITRWHRQNHPQKKIVGGKEVPDKNEEYLLYQTLLGAFPFGETVTEELVDRIKEYMVKAVREAKVNTSWLDPDPAYEEALQGFVEALLRPASPNPFLEAFLPMQKRVAHLGLFNSLSQTLLKLTAPGIPDLYQGSELWDLSLVDPDNRRPVDFEAREKFLRQIQAQEETGLLPLIEELLATREDGRIKLFTLYRTLKARRDHRELFEGGDYLPLRTAGPFSKQVIAFARWKEGRGAVIVVPRFLASLIQPGELPRGEAVWQDTSVELPAEAPAWWRHLLTDQVIHGERRLWVGEIFQHLPLGLLLGETP
ncbi:MAG: malto-oligosyltrehalose synthase [Candidatus Tectomicrobia bacterium]|uniref:Malto-oligosyltrehalose synthase n=1 Tax=Tectimicrobiota bacterium TaxID=2528274 RepID=A0A932CQV8_UNCTE|nr:malto-oligosyltrehalose synthase [Candidatus Tectomicrobia bacterium]